MPKFVLWPNEIDTRISRKYGRLVPKNVAVRAPSVSEIEDAALALGLNVIEKDPTTLNPRLAGLDEEYRSKGHIIIESPHGKSKTVRLLTEKIRELRKRSEGEISKRKKY